MNNQTRIQRNIFCLGDSVTYGVGGSLEVGVIGWPEILKKESDNRVYNLGIPGNTTDDLVKRLQEGVIRVKKNKPSLFIISFGLNDLAQNTTTQEYYVDSEQFVTNINKAIDTYSQLGTVLLLEVTPIADILGVEPDKYGYIRKSEDVKIYNQLLQKISIDRQVDYLAFPGFEPRMIGDDGLHPNKLGYEYLAQIIDLKLESLEI